MQCNQYLDTESLSESKFEVAFLLMSAAIAEVGLPINRLTSVVASLPWKPLFSTVFPPLSCCLQVTHLQHDTLTTAKSQNLFQ